MQAKCHAGALGSDDFRDARVGDADIVPGQAVMKHEQKAGEPGLNPEMGIGHRTGDDCTR